MNIHPKGKQTNKFTCAPNKNILTLKKNTPNGKVVLFRHNYSDDTLNTKKEDMCSSIFIKKRNVFSQPKGQKIF